MAKYISKLINGEELYYLKDDEARANKADKASTVSTILYDTTNKKLTKTINETTSDVVTAADIIADGGVSQMIDNAKSEIKGTATSACDTLGDAETLISAELTRAQTAESALNSGKADKATTLAGYGITDAYTKSETYTKTEVNGLVDSPHQEYVTVDAYASLPATGSKDTIYRVSNYNGSTSQVDASVYSEYAWDGSQYVFLCVKSQIGEVFDITVYNNNTKYADLASALGTDGANVPEPLRKGGMSVKFVQSSDNKYVQYVLTKDQWSLFVTDWKQIVTYGKEIANLLTPFETVDNVYIKTGTAGSAVSTGTNINIEIAKYNVTAGNSYLFSTKQPSSINLYAITWVDVSGNIVSQEYKGTSGQTDIWTDIQLIAPVNAVTMWMNVWLYYSSSTNFKSVTTELIDVGELEGQVERIKNEKEQKKKLRLLLIGNSHSQDSLAYVPFILKNMDIDVDYQIGIAMLSSSTLSQHVSNFENENAVYKYHLYDGETAWRVQTEKTLQYILDDKVWDIIFLQEFPSYKEDSYQPQLNNLINLIAAYVSYPVKFGWHADYGIAAVNNSGPNRSDETITADYERICTHSRNVMDDTVCEILVSTATAVQNARSIASLKAMGAYANNSNNTSGLGYLMANDGVHLQEGLPSQVAAYTFALVLLDVLGCKNRSIIGETTRVTSEWTADKNIPAPHGDCVGSTDANCLIAQKCAIMAVKKPYEMTDMNYIVNPT